jgi:hypothetical protein
MSLKPCVALPWPTLLPSPRKQLAKSARVRGPPREADPARLWAVTVMGREPAMHTGRCPEQLWAARHYTVGPRPGNRPIGFCFIFLFSDIVQIFAKFKNLCRVHLNSESYKPNFVG